jgi:predicted MFS family arabinose efflux permease
VQGNEKGWGSTQIVSFLVGSAVLMALFLLAEVRQRRPMLDLTLFRRPAFTGASLVAFCISASMFSMFLFLTLYIQDVLGYSPLQAGLRFLPVTLLSFFVAPISGRLSVRVPVRMLLGVGMLLVSAGLLSMTAIVPSSGWTTLIPGFLLAGAGIGLINPPLASTAVGVVHYTRAGMASGINNTFRQVGIATGVAGLGAIFQHQVRVHTTTALNATAAGHRLAASAHGNLQGALVSGEVSTISRSLPAPARAALTHAYRVGFTDALTTILLVASAIAFLGAICGLALVRSRDFVTAHAPGEDAVAVAAG